MLFSKFFVLPKKNGPARDFVLTLGKKGMLGEDGDVHAGAVGGKTDKLGLSLSVGAAQLKGRCGVEGAMEKIDKYDVAVGRTEFEMLRCFRSATCKMRTFGGRAEFVTFTPEQHEPTYGRKERYESAPLSHLQTVKGN